MPSAAEASSGAPSGTASWPWLAPPFIGSSGAAAGPRHPASSMGSSASAGSGGASSPPATVVSGGAGSSTSACAGSVSAPDGSSVSGGAAAAADEAGEGIGYARLPRGRVNATAAWMSGVRENRLSSICERGRAGRDSAAAAQESSLPAAAASSAASSASAVFRYASMSLAILVISRASSYR